METKASNTFEKNYTSSKAYGLTIQLSNAIAEPQSDCHCYTVSFMQNLHTFFS